MLMGGIIVDNDMDRFPPGTLASMTLRKRMNS